MRKLLLLFGCLGLFSLDVFGQAIGDYQSFATGAWNNVNTWARYNGLVFINPAPATPTSSDGIITIMANHTVNVPSGFSVTADQIEYDNTAPGATGILVVDASGTLTINNGAGNDVRLLNDFTTVALLQVSGTLQLNTGATMVDDDYGNLSIGPGPITNATYSILPGGIHIHTTGASVDMIPAADWQAGSTCQVNAASGTVPSISGSITFHHFTWNGSGQTTLLNLNAGLRNINGDFNISTTNGNILQLSQITSYTLSIGRDFLIQGNSRVQFATTGTPVVINVTRDFTVSSSNATANTIAFNATGSTTINVTGNFSKSGASSVAFVLGTTGTGILNLRGDFSLTGGTLTRNSSVSSGSAAVNFNGSSTNTFTNSGTISNAINFLIANGKILNMGTSAITGSGTFAIQSGATMGVGSPDGLNISGTALGNIKTTGARTYTAAANIKYNGSGQSLGDEWGSTGALTGVAVNLEIANTGSGVVVNNVTGNTNVVGNLTLTSGSLAIGNTNTIDVKSNFSATGGFIKGDPTSSLTFSGSGSISGNLNFTSTFENLKNFTISRAGTVVLGTNLTIDPAGALAFTSTGNLNITGRTLNVNGDITQSAAGGLISTTATNSNLLIGGTGALSALPFTGTMLLNNVTFGRTTGGTYTWGTAATVSGTLDLNSGTLTHSSGLTMGAGSLFSRSSGTSFTTLAPNTTGAYDVTYTGTLTTGLELPSNSTDLRNLSVAGNATLGGPITINGNLSITSGTLNASANNVTMAGASFSVAGGSFSINSANTVTFSRVGTTTLSGGAIAGTQFGNLVINTGTIVSAPNANLNVSGTWSNSGTFTANSGKITFNGAAQSLNPNGQAFNDVEFAGTLIKTLAGQLDVNGALTITSTLSDAGNFPINVAGSWNNVGTFTAGGGTVTFNGTNQSINPNSQAFFNLTIGGPSGTKTLSNPVVIGGILTINSGTTFDVGVGSNAVTLAGNWVNNGSFTRQTGTVTFNGTTTLSGTAPSLHHVTITGTLVSTAGTLDVSGDWLNSNTFTANGGTVQFSGSTQSITPGAQSFNNVTISGSGIKTVAASTTVNGILTLTAGTFAMGSNSLDLKGNFVSNAASTLTSSAITFSGTTTISGGTAPTFGGITITGPGTLTPTSSFNINGNLVNNGILNAGSGTTTFGGNTTVSGSSTSSFNNVTIGGTLVAPASTINVAGALANNGTFTHSSGTVLFNGTSAISGSSVTTFNNMTVNGSNSVTGPVTLTVAGVFTNNGTYTAGTTLNVAGNFANNSTFTAGAGTVVFNGAVQSISGSANANFNNITSSTSGTVTVSTAQSITGALTMTSGTFNANGNFTLISNASGDARIAQITGGSITGNVIAQRYLPNTAVARSYRFLASPVTNAFASDWKVEFPITGTFNDPSVQADFPAISGILSSSPSMFIYNEAHTPTTTLEDRYETFPPNGSTSTSTALVNGLGYAGYVRQTAPITLDLTGTPQQGSKGVNVTAQSGGGNDGWNLIGNPYAAPINWTNVFIPPGVGAQIALKDNTNNLGQGAGAYIYFTQGGSGIPASYTGTIPSAQAFWVHATLSATITFQEDDKQVIGNPQFIRTGTLPNIVRINVIGNGKADEMLIQFIAGGNDAGDNSNDAYKLKNDYINLYSMSSDGKKMAINGMGDLGCFRQISIAVDNVTPGSHQLSFSELESFSAQTHMMLVDAFTGTSTDISLANPIYSFNVTANAASYGSRFTLVIGEALAAITATGNTRCGSGTVDINASGAPDGNYRWYDVATGGTPINGATLSKFTTPSINKTKTYYVAAANSFGCVADVRLPVVANVTNIDPVTISVNGKIFQSSYTVGNQWYLNGQQIPGATSQTFEPTLPGVYKVEVTSSNCITSVEREFLITGVEPTFGLPDHISIYPNPTSGVLIVAVKSNNEVNARILTLLGATLVDQPLEGTGVKKGTFNLQEQSEGMYILIVQDGSKVYKTRIIRKQ